MEREEEKGGLIRERDIIVSSEQSSELGQVIIKVLIDFLDLLSIKYIYLFSDKSHPKAKLQLTNYQALMPVV